MEMSLLRVQSSDSSISSGIAICLSNSAIRKVLDNTTLGGWALPSFYFLPNEPWWISV
jgi:hypothetical protein